MSISLKYYIIEDHIAFKCWLSEPINVLAKETKWNTNNKNQTTKDL